MREEKLNSSVLSQNASFYKNELEDRETDVVKLKEDMNKLEEALQSQIE